MERANTFIVKDSPALWELADNCARLWNEVNYERKQAYIRYRKFGWYPKHLYEKYAPIIGSATAQQIINKNNEAWRSFLKLKRLEVEGKLPKHITRVSMPRYWKNNGKRELRIIVRNDCYKFDEKYLYLPKGLRLRWKGELKWMGKQGRLEIIRDGVDEVWRGFMAVKVEEHPIRGSKPLYIDLGVINLATVWAEGWRQAIAYSGNKLLQDWWYWTGRIAKEQSRLASVNKAKTSKKLKRLYRIRQRRLRHAVNAMIKDIVERACALGISKIVLGKLEGIRENNNKGGRANSMIHNFWSFQYTVKRFREKSEEYGIEVVEKPEGGTSSKCPECGSEQTHKRKRLFKCLNCNLEAHRDVVGVLNIAALQNGGCHAIGVVAHPLLLWWNGMSWEPKRAMSNRPMKTLEARTSRL